MGHKLPAETVAGWGRTNVRELIACLGPRIQRHFTYVPAKEKLNESITERVCDTVCSV